MFTTGAAAPRASFARAPSPRSTVTTRSGSAPGASWRMRAALGRKANVLGTGSAQWSVTILPSDSSARPSAPAEPMVSPSGSRWDTTAIRRAWLRASTTSLMPACRARPASLRLGRPAPPRSARSPVDSLVPEEAHVDAGGAEVGGNVDRGDRRERDPGVAQLLADQLREHALEQGADAVGPLVRHLMRSGEGQ